MIPVLPFWMLQRQFKAEPQGDAALRLQAPNLPGYEVALQQTHSKHWTGAVYRIPAEGSKELVAECEPFSEQKPAWDAAFELLRRNVIT